MIAQSRKMPCATIESSRLSSNVKARHRTRSRPFLDQVDQLLQNNCINRDEVRPRRKTAAHDVFSIFFECGDPFSLQTLVFVRKFR